MLQLHSNDLTSVNDVHQINPSMVLNDMFLIYIVLNGTVTVFNNALVQRI